MFFVSAFKPHKRVWTALGASLFVASGGTYVVSQNEGTKRSWRFWKEAFPIYLHYRYTEIRTKHQTDEEQSQAFRKLHEHYAPLVEDIVLDLRGFYLKTAQIMSTADYFLPKPYLDFCKRMQNEVPTQFAPGEAEAEVVRSLKLKSLKDVFCEFDPVPLGSASIGQVHSARLVSCPNVKVAVKIMGKNVESRFRADIQTLLDFCRLAMPQLVQSMLEIQKQFASEFDYEVEAHNLLTVRNNILPTFSRQVYIPKPFLEYCTREVLVMEQIEGPTLVKGLLHNFGEYAKSQGTTLEALEAQLKFEMSQPGFKFRDVQEESTRIQLYSLFSSCKDAIRNFPVYCCNTLLGTKWEYHKSVQLIDLGGIIQLLCKVHAHEVLLDGAFSCDAHPGNVLLMPDGRLGLIDFGQFKRISPETRLLLSRMIVALANDDEKEAVRTVKLAGGRSKYNNEYVGYKVIAFWYDRNSQDVLEGRNVQQFLEEMERLDPQEVVPEDFIMPGRVSVMMRGVGNAFGLDLRVSKLWEPVARHVLKMHHVDYVPQKSTATHPTGNVK